MKKKIYQYGPGHLLLVEGTYVVNGDYDLTEDEYGVLRCPEAPYTIATYVMQAPCGGGYNDAIAKALEILEVKDGPVYVKPEPVELIYDSPEERRKAEKVPSEEELENLREIHTELAADIEAVKHEALQAELVAKKAAMSEAMIEEAKEPEEEFEAERRREADTRELIEAEQKDLDRRVKEATEATKTCLGPKQVVMAGGKAASTKVAPLHLIPTVGLEKLAKRFELGIERKGDKSWNALSDNQEVLDDIPFLIDRLGHVMLHAAHLRDKLKAGDLEGLNKEDDASAIAWAGMFLSCAIDRMNKKA